MFSLSHFVVAGTLWTMSGSITWMRSSPSVCTMPGLQTGSMKKNHWTIPITGQNPLQNLYLLDPHWKTTWWMAMVLAGMFAPFPLARSPAQALWTPFLKQPAMAPIKLLASGPTFQKVISRKKWPWWIRLRIQQLIYTQMLISVIVQGLRLCSCGVELLMRHLLKSPLPVRGQKTTAPIISHQMNPCLCPNPLWQLSIEMKAMAKSSVSNNQSCPGPQKSSPFRQNWQNSVQQPQILLETWPLNLSTWFPMTSIWTMKIWAITSLVVYGPIPKMQPGG